MTPSLEDKRRLEEVLATSATKREAAERLGVTPSYARDRAEKAGLLETWRGLPSGLAFAGPSCGGLPTATKRQAEADALIAEALQDAPLDPLASQASSIVGLLLAAYAITGSIAFPRGWVRGVMLAFEREGLRVPSAHSVRWYRSKLNADPLFFASIPNVDLQLLEDLVSR
ncbi:hypothetical protein P2H44_03365 [Albimonas sp. CAU 1670]|uniref:hypothetical protein n=1 Tax=Albimonas sp. CAU 1670 TaxID=3032599 RepID=UPI0023DBE3C9|nr:hypothetical protein [Albimonas sp. CAU 1670]MDF2231583.1 hypothetical protein [Albimonas sp. CAU 1670]